MAEVRETKPPRGAVPGDWAKRMSDTVAHALLVYSALQIAVTMRALRGGVHSLLPFAGLVVLVVAVIPACRLIEARWVRLAAGRGADPALAPAFHKDRLAIWVLAVLLPFFVTGVFYGAALLLGL